MNLKFKRILLYISILLICFVGGAVAYYKIYNHTIEVRIVALMDYAEEAKNKGNSTEAIGYALMALGLNEQTETRYVPYIYEFIGDMAFKLQRYDYSELYYKRMIDICNEKWEKKITKEYFGILLDISCNPEYLYRGKYAYILEKNNLIKESQKQYKLAAESSGKEVDSIRNIITKILKESIQEEQCRGK